MQMQKEEQIAKLQAFIAKFSANASKSSQATSRKIFRKITLEEIKPSSRKYPFIRFNTYPKPGKQILTVENLSYVNPETNEVLFDNISFTLMPNEKW